VSILAHHPSPQQLRQVSPDTGRIAEEFASIEPYPTLRRHELRALRRSIA
jgi:hypothetical protein